MSAVRWENPEKISGGGGGSPWVERLTPLTEKPGEWANLGVFCDSTGALLKNGTLRTPPGRWEFTCRRRELPKGRAYLFARYLGP